jgi:tol-pal system protein YbgF
MEGSMFKFTKSLFLLSLALFFILNIYGCAGSKTAKSQPSEEEIQKQNMNDIESLLGIESVKEETKKKQPKKKSGGEKLGLLETSDVPPQKKAVNQPKKNQSPVVNSTNQNQKIKQLENKIKEKDQIIANLQRELSLKDDQIQQLSASKASATSYTPSSGAIGTVSQDEYENRYNEARAAFEARNYHEAIQLFESLLASTTNNSLADNAQYWIGESQYALRQYDSAILSFEKVFTFTKSNKKDDAQFKLGMCYLQKGDKQKAQEQFDRLRTDYPKSEYIKRIDKVLAKY